jgi:signal peptidase I
MGDNRDHSADSRAWGFATYDNVVGKAIAIWAHKKPGWNMPTFARNRWLEQGAHD